MPKLLRNVLAVVAGIVIGSVVNMALIFIGPSLIPPPAGVDVNTAEGLAAGIHLFEPRHFVTPFLAHAVGTFAGALVAYLVAVNHKKRFAIGLAIFFLCGGIAASFMVPAPAWFIAADLLLAYLPMGWAAAWVGGRMRGGRVTAVEPAV